MLYKEVILLFACVLCIDAASVRDFTNYLSKRERAKHIFTDKRGREYNKCEGKEQPFPCKTVHQCIDLKFVCDNHKDCDDGYDEDPEMCRAFRRPPLQTLENFLDGQKNWIMSELFADKPVDEVASALVVSKSIDDFRRRVGLKLHETDQLVEALMAVETGDKRPLLKMGMKSSAWGDMQDIFGKLIDTGLSPDY